MSNEVSKQILDEMLDHSVKVVVFAEKLRLPRSVLDQLTRSITSIGANYSEAQDASSRRDFINKIYIAKKEAAESVYWLKFIQKYTETTSVLLELQDRTQSFVLLLQKIINSSRTPSLQGKG